MKGQNTITKSFPNEDGSLKVHSVWYTIQGEGPDAGRPAIFVRLSHCNLKCWFCDTQFDSGEVFSLDQLVEEVSSISREHKCSLVVITGGEPLLQNIVPFVYELNRRGIYVSVETAGTVYIDGLESVFDSSHNVFGNIIVCSPKTPKLNKRLIPMIRALKYIASFGDVAEDGLPIMSTQVHGKPTIIYRPCELLPNDIPIYIQPMDTGDPVSTKLNMELAAKICMKHGYRLSIQMHKLVGVE